MLTYIFVSRRCSRCARAWKDSDASTITFAGTRVDQEVAAEVIEALRPVGIQAAFEALEKSQSQTDEKRRSLELAVQKARYEANRIERQYQTTEPENRLVAAELEKRWNNALTQVAEMERRLEERPSQHLS
jgi:septal ring factor EnvC (AmiA/AmiB activator)